ncbi:MAG TPA: tail fiber domain-containing protein, partial [Ferruginibacter sp.]|nr:tail fiber domain-containing protein [Ferruginibacter sp.]
MKKISLVFLSIYFFLSVEAQPIPTQNVGIGTTTPWRAKLELHGSVLSTSAIFGGETTGMSLQSNWPGIGFNEYAANGFRYIADGYSVIQYLNPGNGYMSFVMFPYGIKDATASQINTAMIISNTGNVGIRTNPTNATVYAVKAGNAEGSAIFGGSTYNSHFNYSITEDTYIRGGKSGSKVIINDLSGGKIIMGNGNAYVGINNGVPAFPLEIRQTNGRGLLLVEPNNSFNNWEFRIARPIGWVGSNLYLIYNGQNKGYFTWGTGDYVSVSDRRLKTAIEKMPDVLKKIMQLEPVEYEMKYHNENNEKTFGFI